jgi:hypothetical protein
MIKTELWVIRIRLWDLTTLIYIVLYPLPRIEGLLLSHDLAYWFYIRLLLLGLLKDCECIGELSLNHMAWSAPIA